LFTGQTTSLTKSSKAGGASERKCRKFEPKSEGNLHPIFPPDLEVEATLSLSQTKNVQCKNTTVLRNNITNSQMSSQGNHFRKHKITWLYPVRQAKIDRITV